VDPIHDAGETHPHRLSPAPLPAPG
jgi:hypothetical protein